MAARYYPNIPLLSKYKTKKVLLLLPLVYACLLAVGMLLSTFETPEGSSIEPPKSVIGLVAIVATSVLASIFPSYILLGAFYLTAFFVRFLWTKNPMTNLIRNTLYFPIFYTFWHIIPVFGSFSDRTFLKWFSETILHGNSISGKILLIAILLLMTAICLEAHLSILSYGGDYEKSSHLKISHKLSAYIFSLVGVLVTQIYLFWG